MSRNIFIAVSTGQNVANLPPILELAEKGDRVLWVESRVAREQGWTAGARLVLEGYKIGELAPPLEVDEINNPIEVASRLGCREDVVAEIKGGASLFIVANGGHKLTPIGLIKAFDKHKPTILYGDDRPAVLHVFRDGLGGSPETMPYSRHRLDLSDILRASGYAVPSGTEQPIKLWPANRHLSPPNESYGVDAERTASIHDQHHLWGLAEARPGEPVTFDRAVARLHESEMVGFVKAASQLASRLRKLKVRDVSSLETIPERARNEARAAFNAASRLVSSAQLAEGRGGLVAPDTKIGTVFEEAVARRLLAWLAGKEGLDRGAQSVWWNVNVASTAEPGTIAAQFDLLIVLKNGLLLHIECKSVAADQKDLDARLLNLQRAGSRLARMAVCAPIYTQFSGEPWFEHYHAFRAKVEGLRDIPFLPMTLPGQPASYRRKDGDGVRKIPCATFEEAVERFVRPYIPDP
ncbi:MAG: hypothetical protein HY039_00965 [Nitrospirae bacterium]|nr:hypothetical protein [Nitrospirota bacterium]